MHVRIECLTEPRIPTGDANGPAFWSLENVSISVTPVGTNMEIVAALGSTTEMVQVQRCGIHSQSSSGAKLVFPPRECLHRQARLMLSSFYLE
jgi:hypothetical protein